MTAHKKRFARGACFKHYGYSPLLPQGLAQYFLPFAWARLLN